MNKAQAIDQFWNSFEWVAYDEYSTPDNVPDRHITYTFASDSIDANTLVHGTLWDRSTSWEAVTKKTEEISEAITRMMPVKIDTGYVWFKKGEPFGQRIQDQTDDMIRGVYVNLTVEYLTEF